MKKYGKKYVEASKKVEKNNLYTLDEAIKLAVSGAKAIARIAIAITTSINVKPLFFLVILIHEPLYRLILR